MKPGQETTKRQRTCVGCGRHDAKGLLFRVVRNACGEVSFDAGGRAPGRGAYVCSGECLEAARKTKRLDRALRTKIGEQDFARIAEELGCAQGAVSGGQE